MSRADLDGDRFRWFSSVQFPIDRRAGEAGADQKLSGTPEPSYSVGGRSPSASCSRTLLNQPTYSTIASSSWVRVRQTRSVISSVLKLSTKLSASALS